MRRIAEFLGGLALLAALSFGGSAVAAGLALPVPGPVIGLLTYLALLSLGLFPASVAAARWLSGLLGALIVPPLIGVAAFAPILAMGGWRLAAALTGGCVVTGIVTAAAFRLVSGTR